MTHCIRRPGAGSAGSSCQSGMAPAGCEVSVVICHGFHSLSARREPDLECTGLHTAAVRPLSGATYYDDDGHHRPLRVKHHCSGSCAGQGCRAAAFVAMPGTGHVHAACASKDLKQTLMARMTSRPSLSNVSCVWSDTGRTTANLRARFGLLFGPSQGACMRGVCSTTQCAGDVRIHRKRIENFQPEWVSLNAYGFRRSEASGAAADCSVSRASSSTAGIHPAERMPRAWHPGRRHAIVGTGQISSRWM